MTSETVTTERKGLGVGRIALIAAAVIAMLAIGITVWKRTAPPATIETSKAAGELPESIASLEARLKSDPDDANGWRMLGWTFFETGKYAEAASAYASAVKLEPDNAEYWSSLGEARVMAGKGDVPPEARQAFDRAIAIAPKDPRARYFLAVGKDIAGDHKGAIDDWLALLADTPSGAPWEADVRRIVTEVGAKEKIEVAARLAAIKPPAPAPGGAAIATAAIPGPSSAQMREAATMPKGQQDAMIQGMVDGLETKLKANPDNPNGWIMLMRSRMQLGETAKAATALKSARTAFAGNQQKRGTVDAAAAELGVPGA